MDIILYILATWRISSLLATEPGPWDVFGKLRDAVGTQYDGDGAAYGTNVVSKGLVCIFCNSIWVGAGWLALVLLTEYAPYVALPFALSAGAVIVDEVIGWLGQARPRS